MKKISNKDYQFSPSDLALLMRSPFATWMERYAVDFPDKVKEIIDPVDPLMNMLGQKGQTHEQTYLEEIIEVHGQENVVHIESRNPDTAVGDTLKAMQSGADVIFQACLRRDSFFGFADFLVKRSGQSKFGDYHYEAWDTKLAKQVKPAFIVQLCCYSWMLESVQGVLPEEIVVVNGSREKLRLRIAPYLPLFTELKSRFERQQSDFSGDFNDLPDPVFVEDFGRWSAFAQQRINESDGLSVVAGIRRTQIKKLHQAGISTFKELATTEIPAIKGMATDTFNKLKRQASLQFRSRTADEPVFEINEAEPGKGLSALPPKSPLDVYFDIEGDPLIDGGLEYLWGVSFEEPTAQKGKVYAFKDWWAHNRIQEKQAFEAFIDWVYERWQRDPQMRVYHYASYEITAINKLANREQTRLDEVSELISHNVFIDLYRVVLGGLTIGEPSYSIKKVERFYRTARQTEVLNGGESTIWYENWREADGEAEWARDANGLQLYTSKPGQLDWSKWPELNAIREYNIDDCESTLELVAWLRSIQEQHGIQYVPPVQELLIQVEKTERQEKSSAEREVLNTRKEALIAQYDNSPALQSDPIAGFIRDVVKFHDRERKPSTINYFQRLEKTNDELVDDDTVVFNVNLQHQQPKGKKLVCSGAYDLDQPLRDDKIKSGRIRFTDVRLSKIEMDELDGNIGQIRFEINAEHAEALTISPLVIFGDDSVVNTSGLERRLCDIAEQYFNQGQLAKPILNLLTRQAPNVPSGLLPINRQRYQNDDAYTNALCNLALKMQDSVLCIQGPPGSGKTTSAVTVIQSLIDAGYRIGVTSNSHAAILNLLKRLAIKRPDMLIAKVGGDKQDFEKSNPDEQYPNFQFLSELKSTKKRPIERYQVVGATLYSFARDLAFEHPVDYLFVDEASQVALAILITVGGACKNIIMMGDQMQLEQPIQGTHPGDSGRSALEYFLQDHAVVPDDMGVFLERSYRMHSTICQPLSEVVYEGKLQSDPANDHQQIRLPSAALIQQSCGIAYVPIEHEGNTQASEEEVDLCERLVNELHTGVYFDKQGNSHPITPSDILIMAPYNMQVIALRKRLGPEYSIGSIDKFQGQEAPVVILSMAVSDVNDSPRGLDFVFAINRLNVAVSRAKALAIIVANPALKNPSVHSLDKMQKVGTYCRLVS